LAQPVAPEQQVQDDIEVQQENVEVLQEIEVEAVEGEAQQGVVVAEQPQRIADMPPNLVQLLVQQQQTVQREHTNEELQQSPAAGLPVPRFNTPSPDLNQTRSSIFSKSHPPYPLEVPAGQVPRAWAAGLFLKALFIADKIVRTLQQSNSLHRLLQGGNSTGFLLHHPLRSALVFGCSHLPSQPHHLDSLL
jgi:hypothetical protein